MFQKIDWFLLSHFEKGCHSLQRLTGKTNYYYAGLCSFLIVLISLGVYFDVFPKGLAGENMLILDREHPAWFWYGIFLFTNYFVWMWKINETRAYDRISRGLANSDKRDPLCRFLRLNFVVLTPILLLSILEIQIYDKVFHLLLVLFLFFISCDPLPPCKGKVKEWLESFGRKQTLIPIKTEE